MVDGFSDGFGERYDDLLSGSYDCVDRVVLNAYYSLGHNPGGFRTWWRRLHGDDEQLDNAHLLRMTAGSPAGSEPRPPRTGSRSSTAAAVNANTRSPRTTSQNMTSSRECS